VLFLQPRVSKTFSSPLVGEGRVGGPKNKIAAEKKNGFLPPGNLTARLVWHSCLDAIAFKIADLFSSTHLSEARSRRFVLSLK
jgi:hypothetical protein